MRFAVILPTLGGGGMERMRLHMVRIWLEQGIEVDLIVSRKEGILLDLVPESVQVFEIAAGHPLLFPIGLWRYIRRRRPTHLLSAGTDVNALTLLVLRCLKKSLPTAISFHIHLSKELKTQSFLKSIKSRLAITLLRQILNESISVIAVSQGVADDLRRLLSLDDNQLHTIYNPVITNETRNLIDAKLPDSPVSGQPWMIYVGRLTPQKGLEVLLDAFNLLSKKANNVHLVILGEGPLRAQLKNQVNAYGLQNFVHFVGFQVNPLPWIREADLLVLPSIYEGLGNVLIEALACGTQIVATDCPSGPAEILSDGKYGRLVPPGDAAALATAILKTLNGKHSVPKADLRKRSQDFSAERAAVLYKAALMNERPSA